jgi:hypothetical protein
MWLVVKILAGILTSIHVDTLSKAMALSIAEHSLIEITVRPSQLALTVRHSISHLTDVLQSTIECDRLPSSRHSIIKFYKFIHHS